MKFRSELQELTPYEPGKPVDEIQREHDLDQKPVKLASNENPYPIPESKRNLFENQFQDLNRYPDGGSYHLKESLSEFYNWPREGIAIGAGSDEVLDFLAKTTLQPGDGVISAKPSFIRHSMVAKMMGANCIEVPLHDDFTLNMERMNESISDRTKWICLPNPNNPTSRYISESSLRQFIETIPADTILIIDEAYYEFMNQSDYPDGFRMFKKFRGDEYPEIIVLRTFSKAYGLAGLRVGYGLMDPAIVNEIDKVRPPFNVTRPAQALAESMLGEEQYIENCRIRIQNQRERIIGELEQQGIKYVPPSANFMLVKVSENGDARGVYEQLLHQGVIVRPMEAYGLPNYIRVTVGSSEQNTRFLTALKRVL